jgi:hypothetical protein
MQTETNTQSCACPPNAQPRARLADRFDVASILRDACSSRLFLMTTLGAASGQITALAANGLLAVPSVAMTVGLTMIGGVGAFLAAIEEASLDETRGRLVFAATALLSIGVNVAAAAAGLALSGAFQLDHLRYFIAGALAVVAWEIARQETISLGPGIPAPTALVGLGVLLEALV